MGGIRGFYDTKINEKQTRDLDTVYWAMNGHDRTVMGLERAPSWGR